MLFQQSVQFVLYHMPESLAGRIYYWLLKPVPESFAPLYELCRLRYAPGIVLQVPKSREYMYDCIALTGVYETQLTQIIADHARAGGVFVDVGANVGYFTTIWAALQPTNQAVAIEASPIVYPILERNLANNNLTERVECVQCAVSDLPGVLSFAKGDDEPTGWGRIAHTDDEAGVVPVDAMRLDAILKKYSKIDFLKIDVEGAEQRVLEGAGVFITDQLIDTIYIEINRPGAKAMGLAEAESLDLLSDAGYCLRRLNVGGEKDIEDWLATAR
ncbi:MAG: FkbM family methyltransferase [Pseudomonadota bacterium]